MSWAWFDTASYTSSPLPLADYTNACDSLDAWNWNYSTPSISGGRIQIDCTTDWHAVWTPTTTWSPPTSPVLKMTGSSVFLRAEVPAAIAGGNGQFWVNVYNTSVSDSLSIFVDSGTLKGFVRDNDTGVYTTSSGPTYNATTMAWLRIRESSGTVYWDYSQDGETWTNFDSTTHGLGTSMDTVGIDIGAYLDSGTATLYIDSINIAPVTATVSSTATASLTTVADTVTIHEATVSLSATAALASTAKPQYGQQNAEDQTAGTIFSTTTSSPPNINPTDFFGSVANYDNTLVTGGKSIKFDGTRARWYLDSTSGAIPSTPKFACRGYFRRDAFLSSAPYIFRAYDSWGQSLFTVGVSQATGNFFINAGYTNSNLSWSPSNIPCVQDTVYRVEAQVNQLEDTLTVSLYEGHSLTPLTTATDPTYNGRFGPITAFYIGTDESTIFYWDDVEWTWGRNTPIGPNRSVSTTATASLTTAASVVKTTQVGGTVYLEAESYSDKESGCSTSATTDSGGGLDLVMPTYSGTQRWARYAVQLRDPADPMNCRVKNIRSVVGAGTAALYLITGSPGSFDWNWYNGAYVTTSWGTNTTTYFESGTNCPDVDYVYLLTYSNAADLRINWLEYDSPPLGATAALTTSATVARNTTVEAPTPVTIQGEDLVAAQSSNYSLAGGTYVTLNTSGQAGYTAPTPTTFTRVRGSMRQYTTPVGHLISLQDDSVEPTVAVYAYVNSTSFTTYDFTSTGTSMNIPLLLQYSNPYFYIRNFDSYNIDVDWVEFYGGPFVGGADLFVDANVIQTWDNNCNDGSYDGEYLTTSFAIAPNENPTYVSDLATTYSTEWAHSYPYSWRQDPEEVGTCIVRINATNASQTVAFRTYFFVKSLSNETESDLVRLNLTGSNPKPLKVKAESDGTLSVYVGSAYEQTESGVVLVDTIYRLEVVADAKANTWTAALFDASLSSPLEVLSDSSASFSADYFASVELRTYNPPQ